MVVSRKRKPSKVVHTTRRKKKAVVPPAAVYQHSLITMAANEPDPRRKQFLVALACSLAILTPDDMDVIEPHLRRRLGGVVVQRAAEGLGLAK